MSRSVFKWMRRQAMAASESSSSESEEPASPLSPEASLSPSSASSVECSEGLWNLHVSESPGGRAAPPARLLLTQNGSAAGAAASPSVFATPRSPNAPRGSPASPSGQAPGSRKRRVPTAFRLSGGGEAAAGAALVSRAPPSPTRRFPAPGNLLAALILSPSGFPADNGTSSATDSAFEIEEFPPGVDFVGKLPYELAAHVLSFIDSPTTLAVVQRVSRRWNEVARDNELWRIVYQTTFAEEAVNSEAYLARRRASSLLGVGAAPPAPLVAQHAAVSLADTPAASVELFHTPNGPGRVRPADARLRSSESSQSLASVAAAAGNLVPRRQRSSASAQSLTVPLTRDLPYLPGVTAIDWRNLYKQRQDLLNNWWRGVMSTTTLAGHDDSVYCIQFDHDRLVSGSRDRTVKFWDLRTGACTRTLQAHAGSVLCLQYDSRLLITGSSDTTAIVWELESGRIVHKLRGHVLPVLDVRIDGDRCVTCSKDCTIRVWDVATGAYLRLLTGHRAAVNAVHLRGRLLASASGDCLVKLWDIQTGQCLRDFGGHTRGIACVQFDGEYIVSGSNDRSIRVWRAATGECVHVLKGHTDLVRTLCFDKQHIVSGSYDQSIKVWDLRTGALMQNYEDAHESWVFQVQLDAGRIISASQDQRMTVWDFSRGIPDLAAFQ